MSTVQYAILDAGSMPVVASAKHFSQFIPHYTASRFPSAIAVYTLLPIHSTVQVAFTPHTSLQEGV